jgi:hypothetical protein
VLELPSPYKDLPDLGREIRSCLESSGLWPLALGAMDLETGRAEDWERYYQSPRAVLSAEEIAAHREEFRLAAALHPLAMRIRLITITDTLGNHAQIWSDRADPVANEREVIERTFAVMGPGITRIMWIGLNLLRFDWPRLVQRALIHRLRIPDEARGYRTRWADQRHIHINDIMEYLAQGGDTRGLTLHNVSRAFGLPGKTGDFGEDFGEAWDAGNAEVRRKLCLYNLVDNDQCLRVGLYSRAIEDYARKYKSDFKMKDMPQLLSEPFVLPRESISLLSAEGEEYFRKASKPTQRRIPLAPERVMDLDHVPQL